MKPALGLALLTLATVPALAAGLAGQEPGPVMRGVPNPAQARTDYQLKCQGCHHPDGSGNAVNTPPLADETARFLHVPGGREFLGQVPGVASVDLGDERLAQLLNWTLYRFDPQHVPADFKPYSAAEIAKLRKTPLRLDRLEVRSRLVADLTRAGLAPK